MTHNFSLVNSIAQCDVFLANHQEKMEDQNFSKMSLTNRIASGAESAEQIDAELTAAEAQLALFNSLLPTTPDGPEKNELLDDIGDTENEIIRLKRRQRNNGLVAQLMREIDLELLLVKIAASQDIQAQAETRKSELQSAAAN